MNGRGPSPSDGQNEEQVHGNREGEVVQRGERLRLQQSGRWFQGCVRPSLRHHGSGFQEPERGAERRVRDRRGTEGSRGEERPSSLKLTPLIFIPRGSRGNPDPLPGRK